MSDRFAALALVLLLIAAPAAAASPKAKAEARRHFDAGVAHAKAGEYRDALTEFTRAYDLAPSPTALYNIATAQAELGQMVEAIDSFHRYLGERSETVPAERRAQVLQRIAELESRTGTITVHASPETAKVYLDGQLIEAAAAAKGVRVNPGPHRVLAAADGYDDAKREIDVGRAAVFDVTLALAPVPPAPRQEPVVPDAPPLPPPPAAPPPAIVPATPALQQPASAPRPAPRSGGVGVQRAIGYGVAAAGALALAAGGVLYLKALSDRDKAINAGCTATACPPPGDSDWRSAQNGVTWSRRAAIAGGVLVAAGLTVVLIAPSSRDAPAGLAVAGRF
jgi:tetratricopeptide (TPR) repeat protein